MNGFNARIIIICALMITSSPLASQKARAAEPPQISAAASAMIDVNSGRILFEKNADEEKPIASITKIMTAIIALEQGDLDEKVTVSARAAGMEGSSVYLKAGEQMKLDHLLYGLMLRSGNDAAVAIAEHIGGSVEGFVMLMNEKATYLGMTHTHFENPHGLDAAHHYSTARDMATLTAYALGNEHFQEIVATKATQVPNPGEKWNRKWYNKNKMLQMYAGANGVKTGYTSQAHRTLVSSATRDGQQLVTVTLNAADDWDDSIALLNYGFTEYAARIVVDQAHPIDERVITDNRAQPLMIVPEHSFIYPLSDQEFARIQKQVNIRGELPPGLTEGVRVGEISITLAGKEIGSVPLMTKQVQNEAARTGLWENWAMLLSPVWSESAP